MWSNLLVACLMTLPALIYGVVQWLTYRQDRSHRADMHHLYKATGYGAGILRSAPAAMTASQRMGRPFALKSGRPCRPLEISLPTKPQRL